MLVSKLLSDLSYNELSNLSLSNEGSGTIAEDKINRVINITNDALMDLFSRFTLSTKEIAVQSLEWKSIYTLRADNARTSTSSELKYILDTPADPFKGDIVSILGVRNEEGIALPLNDSEQYASVFTPQFDTIQLTHVGFDQVFFVEYQARHGILLGSDSEGYQNQLIDLPIALENALRYKVASYIFSSMSGQEYGTKVQEFDSKYEAQCHGLEERGLTCSTPSSTNVKLHRRGFV